MSVINRKEKFMVDSGFYLQDQLFFGVVMFINFSIVVDFEDYSYIIVADIVVFGFFDVFRYK